MPSSFLREEEMTKNNVLLIGAYYFLPPRGILDRQQTSIYITKMSSDALGTGNKTMLQNRAKSFFIINEWQFSC